MTNPPAAPTIRTEADLQAIEAAGMAAFLPAASPAALLRRAAAVWPDAVAIRYLPGVADVPDATVTFAALYDRVRQAASAFRGLGVTAGRPVALFTPNTLNAQVALWGAELAGLACPINPMLNRDSIVGLLRASGAAVAVVLGVNGELDVWHRVRQAVRIADPTIKLLDIDADEPSPGRDGNFEALVAAEPLVDWPDPDPDAVAALYPTGGTTGAPKLTLHTHRNEAFASTGAARMYDLRPGEVILNGFPLFHVAGAFVYGLSAIVAGAAQLIPGRLGMRNRPFLNDIWLQARTHGITVLAVVPTVLSALLAAPSAGARNSGVRVAYTGGSVLPTDLADAFELQTGIPVRNILGMTECSGILTVEPFHAPRTPGSTGLRLPFCAVWAEPDGIVATRGPNVSPGYLNGTGNTGTFHADGTLVSGDIGHLDAEGRLFVTGRAKDVIFRGSHNLDPTAIEDAVLRHPDVAVAAAVGLPDPYAGELPIVFVTLRPDATATEAEIEAFAAEHVPEPAARPKRIWIVDAMPLTPVGKIFKPALRAEAACRAVAAALAVVDPPPQLTDIVAGDRPATVVVHMALPMDEDRLRAALVGMPLSITFEVAGRAS
jgi:fatty-acyl-CoA synthase